MYKLNLLLLLLASAFIATPVQAQFLSLENDLVKHNKDKRPCIKVMLEPGTDEVKEAWEDYIKDKHDVKLKGHGFLSNKDVLKAEDVKFPAISEKNLNFYTRVVEEKDQTSMCVFASLGYDIYLNPVNYPGEYQAMRQVVISFLHAYLPEYYSDNIGEIRENVGDLKDDQEDMEEELEKNRKEIEKLSKRNEELVDNLADTREKLAAKQTLLQEREILFNRIKSQLDAMTRQPYN